jgi:hypothetical protein
MQFLHTKAKGLERVTPSGCDTAGGGSINEKLTPDISMPQLYILEMSIKDSQCAHDVYP